MSVEQTLSIIKPDGVQKNLVGEIYGRFEKSGLQLVAARMMHLTSEQAQSFYAVHAERPFFSDLVSYMTSGPVMVQVLEGDDAIARNREIMGATNPADADPATIGRFGTHFWISPKKRAVVVVMQQTERGPYSDLPVTASIVQVLAMP